MNPAKVASAHDIPAAPVAENAQPGSKSKPSWFTNQASPWDAEAQKASQLASTWEIPVETATSIQAAVTAVEKESAKTAAPVIEEEPGSLEIEEEPGLLEELPYAPAPRPSTARELTPAAAKPAAPTSVQRQADLDTVVAKVLEKISPEMLRQMTRELLKPVVEAIVRGELDKKK